LHRPAPVAESSAKPVTFFAACSCLASASSSQTPRRVQVPEMEAKEGDQVEGRTHVKPSAHCLYKYAGHKVSKCQIPKYQTIPDFTLLIWKRQWLLDPHLRQFQSRGSCGTWNLFVNGTHCKCGILGCENLWSKRIC